MNKKIIKLCLTVMMTVSFIIPVYAKTSKILVEDNNKNYYVYDLNALNEEAVNDALGLDAPLFKSYLNKKVRAFYDDKKGYVKEDAVNDAAVIAAMNNEQFNIDFFTENVSQDKLLYLDELPKEVTQKDGKIIIKDSTVDYQQEDLDVIDIY